ncbi:hypothetical protein GUJ93_ZPchr0008g11467 [Zizania palustris]|uniref:Uncharacterized protein n=1 Tax=Zizania palustris TaxID=103762 RepID=A0A8J5RL25_ZIZPA|nr:hypothetical protein GUJ93_ZPchr0008g11467 [Zizania palustris]
MRSTAQGPRIGAPRVPSSAVAAKPTIHRPSSATHNRWLRLAERPEPEECQGREEKTRGGAGMAGGAEVEKSLDFEEKERLGERAPQKINARNARKRAELGAGSPLD